MSAPKFNRGARVAEPTPPRPIGANTLTLAGPSAMPPAVSSDNVPPAKVSPLAESRALPWEKFWLVWSPSEARPQRRHGSLESAQREADRLHLMYGKEFLVFEATQIATLDGPSSAADVRP